MASPCKRLPLPTSPTQWGGVFTPSPRVGRVGVGRYLKLADAADETLEFDLGKCRIALDFSRIWPK